MYVFLSVPQPTQTLRVCPLSATTVELVSWFENTDPLMMLYCTKSLSLSLPADLVGQHVGLPSEFSVVVANATSGSVVAVIEIQDLVEPLGSCVVGSRFLRFDHLVIDEEHRVGCCCGVVIERCREAALLDEVGLH